MGLRWSQEEGKSPTVQWEVLVNNRQIIPKQHTSASTGWVLWAVEAQRWVHFVLGKWCPLSESWTVTPRILEDKEKEKEQCQREPPQQRPKSNSRMFCHFETKNSPVFVQETGGGCSRRSMEWPWLGGHIKKSWLFYEHTRMPLGWSKQDSEVRLNTCLSPGQAFPPGM